MFEPLPDNAEFKQEPQRRFFSGSHIAIAAVVALTIAACSGYAVHEHGVAATALEQNAAITASFKSTNAQVEQLTAKINELSAPKPQVVEAPAPTRSESSVKGKSGAPAQHRSALRRAVRDDPRWKKVESQLDEQGRAISSTQQDLSNTRTELQGSIARTHAELVVLQRKGERRYYEFDIQKAKQFSHAGSMNIKLRKSDAKHQYADLDLLVDDRVVTKKHVNLYEPAMFYTSEDEQPAQVVINKVSKDHIHGYVSEPKYGKAELSSLQPESPAQSRIQTDAETGSSPRLQQRGTLANKQP
jgi:hypothetical protein